MVDIAASEWAWIAMDHVVVLELVADSEARDDEDLLAPSKNTEVGDEPGNGAGVATAAAPSCSFLLPLLSLVCALTGFSAMKCIR